MRAFLILPLALLLCAAPAWASLHDVVAATPARSYDLPLDISDMHPSFPLLDFEGRKVLDSGEPLSLKVSCGACHDTDFIDKHSFHSSLNYDAVRAPGDAPSGRMWDLGDGPFGRWDPVVYDHLDQQGSETALLKWASTYGQRHVGGGPLETLGSEHDCLICHMPNPNMEARRQMIREGRLAEASTATLLGSDLVSLEKGRLKWNRRGFDGVGNWPIKRLPMMDPPDENCSACHGLVYHGDRPFAPSQREGWRSQRTGQVFSEQRLSDSGLNIEGKDELARSWDIHAERLLKCTSCHYSDNNPMYRVESSRTKPGHLEFDGRRLNIGEYLKRPSHDLVKGRHANEAQGSMRHCEACHNEQKAHDWLPYADRHFEKLTCEACHVPKLYFSNRMQLDWTVLDSHGHPLEQWRGVQGDPTDPTQLNSGYEPALLPRPSPTGHKLQPFSLNSSWFWVEGSIETPVSIERLQAVFMKNGTHNPALLPLFDANADGEISPIELRLDTQAKTQFITQELERCGSKLPKIKAEIEANRIAHGVTHGRWAVRKCETCHSQEGRLLQATQLARYLPGGVLPKPLSDDPILANATILSSEEGGAQLTPASMLKTSRSGLYLLGAEDSPWIDLIGLLSVLGVVAGTLIHGTIRYKSSKGRRKNS
jgi:hypothetical protein